jgi:hypothetical protein
MKIRTFLFSYNYEGVQYSLEIPAHSILEARARLNSMCYAQYDGELMCKIPAIAGAGIFVRLLTWFKNQAGI